MIELRPPVARAGLRVSAIEPGSDLARRGLRTGDRLLAIDGLAPRDVIDVQLELPGAERLLVERTGQRLELDVSSAHTEAAAALLSLDDAMPGGIRECNNHCEFCFIRGLPRGLRSTLYVFDDDYRYSFLWGNFLTLTNLSEADWARIGSQRLSPLNVSVHATDAAVRRMLLANRHAPDILPQLERLAGLGIQVNAQVVLCAGINDGACLEQTIDELAALHPTVRSLSVVPVGLTRYSRTRNIRRPSPAEAALAVETVERWQARLRPRLHAGFVYASDELYLLAGRSTLPAASAYDGFPVLSNGVGMLRGMLDTWERLLAARTGPPPRARRHAWLSAPLAAPALQRMAVRWHTYAGWQPEVIVVVNDFFGSQVTVSGLLTGADLIRALRALPPDIDDIVLPRSAFGFDGQHTLDGIPAEEVGAAHPGRVHLASTPEDLAAILNA